MLPWVVLDTADIPGGGTLRLKRRGGEFSIMLGSNELMNSRVHGSEQALARLALGGMAAHDRARVLIGGLGMGFTLRAALPLLHASARLDVAELVPAVADWARGPMAALHGDSLDDPRVSIRIGDVAGIIRAAQAAYDAILLDVDNGPEGLSLPANDWLYGPSGLDAASAALRPGGVLAVWSSAPHRRFPIRLRDAGFAVSEHVARATPSGGGAKHMIWLARRP